MRGYGSSKRIDCLFSVQCLYSSGCMRGEERSGEEERRGEEGSVVWFRVPLADASGRRGEVMVNLAGFHL